MTAIMRDIERHLTLRSWCQARQGRIRINTVVTGCETGVVSDDGEGRLSGRRRGGEKE
jgi:hypothetical protein